MGLEGYRTHLDIYSELLQLFYCYLNVCYCDLKVKAILGYREHFSHVEQVSFSSFCCSGTVINHHGILYLCQCTKKTSKHCTDQVSCNLMLSTSKPETPVGLAWPLDEYQDPSQPCFPLSWCLQGCVKQPLIQEEAGTTQIFQCYFPVSFCPETSCGFSLS